MEAYQQLGLQDSVVKYARLFAKANDEGYLQETAAEIIRVQSLYDYTEYQKKSFEKSKEADSLRHYLYASLFFAVLCLISLSLYFRWKKMESLSELKEINSKYISIAERFQNASEELLAIKENHEAYISAKEKEVTGLQNMLSGYIDHANIDSWNKDRQLKSLPVVVHAHKLSCKGQALPTKAKTDICAVAEKFLPEFVANLKMCTKLTQLEFETCVLTRLGFISSEIAVLLNISCQHETNLRRRANKKIFKQESAKTFAKNILGLK